ncbi:hypothetical protein FM105_00960 [Brevibacterium yomogidense]|uniref:Uncharacterized protein n=1 Tax=Brevibacterium yomogidense TaxID=946573 RepID=A0A1X6WUJ1_9MICO|nr:hypothetical protein FM105_00960 [Brevibacterium yomogidense]
MHGGGRDRRRDVKPVCARRSRLERDLRKALSDISDETSRRSVGFALNAPHPDPSRALHTQHPPASLSGNPQETPPP